MLDFTRSFITWTRPHRQRHPYYKWHGGFVGQLGDIYRVRMQVEATMDVVDPSNDLRVRHFLIYRCRTELTIATDQFFMLPSGEWCEVFSRDHSVPIARLPSDVSEPGGRTPWNERFSDLEFRPVTLANANRILDGRAVNAAAPPVRHPTLQAAWATTESGKSGGLLVPANRRATCSWPDSSSRKAGSRLMRAWSPYLKPRVGSWPYVSRRLRRSYTLRRGSTTPI